MQRNGEQMPLFLQDIKPYGNSGNRSFYIRPGLRLIPLKFGGTGTDSAKLVYENDDYEYEPGTHNLPGITALYAGVGFILETGVETIHKKEEI